MTRFGAHVRLQEMQCLEGSYRSTAHTIEDTANGRKPTSSIHFCAFLRPQGLIHIFRESMLVTRLPRDLFEATMQVCPDGIKTLNNLGSGMLNVDEAERAVRLLQTAVEVYFTG